MKPTIPGYFDASAVRSILSVSRAGLAKIATREGWPRHKVNGGFVYPVEDVRDYRDLKIRTELARRLGWSGKGLYRDETNDFSCPTCDGFALEIDGVGWACYGGHKGQGVNND